MGSIASPGHNVASWIKEKCASCVVDPAETPTPGPGELLIKVECIAFSPIEFKIQRFETS